MRTLHIHINWSQLLLQKIALCLPPPRETIISDEIEKPVNDNLRLSRNCGLQVQCKWIF